MSAPTNTNYFVCDYSTYTCNQVTNLAQCETALCFSDEDGKGQKRCQVTCIAPASSTTDCANRLQALGGQCIDSNGNPIEDVNESCCDDNIANQCGQNYYAGQIKTSGNKCQYINISNN
jgi:hypothetical protein